jgi:putative NADPH-quinone reductase
MTNQSTKKVLLVIGQGRQDTLCHHLLDVVRAELIRDGAECRVHDLLLDGFDPVLRLGPGETHARQVSEETDALLHRYQEDAKWANAHVILHPVWWFSPPAILKGWVERVLCEGVGVDYSNGKARGLLGARRALIVQTFKSMCLVDSILTRGISYALWRRGILGPLGIHSVRRVAVHSVAKLDAARMKVLKRRLEVAAQDLLE